MSNTPTNTESEPSTESETESANTTQSTDAITENPASTETKTDAELAAQVELLADENKRLRELVAAAQRSRYRGTAIALCGVGLLCGLLGYVTPAASTVLFALGGTGVFGGVLTYFLTPDRFISADVGRRVYTATAESFERLAGDLGLSDRRVYVATSTAKQNETREATPSSWLFVPQSESTTIPEATALDAAFVVDDGQRGLSLRPTGSGLFEAVTTSLTEPLGTTAESLCAQLSDAIVEDLELAQTVEYETDPQDGRVSVRIIDAVYGDGTRFDHPIVSLLAVGLSTGLETPVETTVTGTEPLTVTFRWEPSTEDS
jgi:hypothetical protein